jgi:hypothetical protein
VASGTGERVTFAVVNHRVVEAQPERGEQRVDRRWRVARPDLGDVAGLPLQLRRILRLQCQVPRAGADAAGIEFAAFEQSPGLVARRRPVRQFRRAGEHAEVVLPVPQRAVVAIVDLDQVEQRSRAGLSQVLVEPMPETAIEPVAAVAEREDGIAQARQRRARIEHVAHERQCRIRRIALAGGADHEQRAPAAREQLAIDLSECAQAHAHPRAAQRARGALGDLLRESGLAGISDEQIGIVLCHRIVAAPRTRAMPDRDAERGVRRDRRRRPPPLRRARCSRPPRIIVQRQ